MHGRERSEYKAMQRDPKVAAKLKAKAEQWYALTATIAKTAKEGMDKPEAAASLMPLTEKLLTVNPVDQRRIQISGSEEPAQAAKTPATSLDWNMESRLTATALQNNPKAYGAWFHRKWCLVQLQVLKDPTLLKILQQELGLTVQFLDRDERNFHCWNYRRFVVSLLLLQQEKSKESHLHSHGAGTWRVIFPKDDAADQTEASLLMGAQVAATSAPVVDKAVEENEPTPSPQTDWIAQEWQFTQQKIQQNFSNFSAFHYRSKLYPLVQPPLSQELEVVENAIFTEPDDQTAWWYQSFLLRQQQEGESLEIWENHVQSLGELVDEVPHSKWALLGLLNCGMMIVKLKENETEERKITLLAQCQKLMELDPDRKGRYASLEQRIRSA
eukprot:CAMPEP_0168756128 /NCGR_PEP_ID=MMETSP0724-20121128/20434_1 /TAXON_ID=265536 /ORGANISM="Amphiprora sp., Strain CCMP467" /LENGTH=384 /DNA_ID=CAMNT_0008804783 /DNA_START=51 /DNA_END=1206 /DNA_ORIENTATION=+